MQIKSQDGNVYDIYEFSVSQKIISCKDNADRRRKKFLGEYESVARATDVFQMLLNETSGYFEMPKK